MPDYKQSSVAGTSWQRCHTVTVHNQLGQTPRIEFQEEKVINIDGANIPQWVGGCTKDFSPTGSFPLLDPATNAPTSQTMSHGELYVALYSLYMQTALERDAALP